MAVLLVFLVPAALAPSGPNGEPLTGLRLVIGVAVLALIAALA
jgi:hypothetical protein